MKQKPFRIILNADPVGTYLVYIDRRMQCEHKRKHAALRWIFDNVVFDIGIWDLSVEAMGDGSPAVIAHRRGVAGYTTPDSSVLHPDVWFTEAPDVFVQLAKELR